MSGRQLAERLRAVRPAMKVLFMSGYTDTAIVNRGVLDPGIAFLQKPLTPETLTQKIREVLDVPSSLPVVQIQAPRPADG
jgi:FixJ family two-component response regulator